MREKLINTIFDLASDEIVTIKDAKRLALMTVDQLVDELISMLEYYRNNE